MRLLQDDQQQLEDEEEGPSATSKTDLLLSTLQIYVPIWAVGFVLYCLLRKWIPRTYAVRQWVESIKTPLANNQFGYLSWIWQVYSFPSDQLLEEVGLDALCFLRLINMGFRLSVVGCLNSVWLIPVYCTAKNSIQDVSDLGINALPKGSVRYIATVLASYLFFGRCFYEILKEFRWFVRARHVFLQKFNARNYTCLVRNIPEPLRSNVALQDHFTGLYGEDRVLEAHCCLFLNNLEGVVKKRQNCIGNLQHAVAEHRLGKKVRPLRRDPSRYQEMESQTQAKIELYTNELEELNVDIAQRIEAIEQRTRPRMLSKGSAFRNVGESDFTIATAGTSIAASGPIRNRETAVAAATRANKKSLKDTKQRLRQAKEFASTLVTGVKDGTPDDAGFVTFKSLVAVHGALQMRQHPKLFAMETEMAPDPNDIFWGNVGKDREVLQTGRLLSIGLTLVLCLFWTFIVTFIVNLADSERLAEEFSWMQDFLIENPWAEKTINLLSPVLLLSFNSGLLPIILKAISRFEFPASDSLLEASAFWKMAAFTVSQTFFVTLISESVVDKVGNVFKDPKEFVALLSEELPARGVYFMQLLVASTCIGTLVELFRVVPLIQSAVRAHVGRRLTEKERKEQVGPFKPLCVVDKIYFSRVQARFLLYFMVLFVYSSISPLVNWFCCLFFLFLGSVYRYQFVFNYPSTPDSGGQIWLMFIAVLLSCIVIAQITLWGFLGLKGAGIALSLLIPLMVVTALFIIYLVQNFFSLGTYLPAHAGRSTDLDNTEAGVSFAPFRDLYKNPALLKSPADTRNCKNVATFSVNDSLGIVESTADTTLRWADDFPIDENIRKS